MNSAAKFSKTTLINTVVTGAQDNKFANQSVLAGRTIKHIIARIESNGLKTSNGIDVSGNLENVYLVLVDSNNNKIHDGLPLYLLDPTKNGNSGLISLETTKIDWTKSSLYFADATHASANRGREIPLLVVFE